jgi:peptidoglycan/LPS O-acetylase OafA/YrhL
MGWPDTNLAQLNLGVSIFFVISGFLLYRPFGAARLAGERSPPLLPYAIRRVARIVPAYWVALTIIALWLPVSGTFTAEGIVTYYGFLQAYDPDTVTGGIGQAWTLTVEVSFYTLLPLLAIGDRRLPGPVVRSELALVAALFAAGLAWKILMLPQGGSFGRSLTAFVTLPAFLDQFAVGMGLALASVALAERRDQPGVVRLVESRPWLPWLVAALAFAALGARDGLLAWGPARDLIEKHELKTVIAAGLIAPAVFGERAGLAGELGAVPLAVIGLAVTAAVAAASWYGLERHALRLGRRLAGPAGALETRAATGPLAPSPNQSGRRA